MAILSGIDGLIRDVETILDEAKIEAVKSGLEEGASAIVGSGFADVRLPGSAFGGSARGSELGHHHERAHQVITETLEGVVADLRDFRAGVAQAKAMIHEIDADSAGALDRQREALAAIVDANRTFAADDRYHQARNDQEQGDGR
jgi:hypothetical protein